MAQGGRNQPLVQISLKVTQDNTGAAGDNEGLNVDVQANEIRQVAIGQTQSPDMSGGRANRRHLKSDPASTNASECRDNFVTEEFVAQLIDGSEYEEAKRVVKELPRSQRQRIFLSECYCGLGKYLKATECICDLHDLMASSSPLPNTEHLYELGLISTTKNNYIRAIILFSCAMKICCANPDSSGALRVLRSCDYKSSLAMERMTRHGGRMRPIVSNVGIGLLEKNLSDLQSVKASDENERTETEANCWNNLGNAFVMIERYDKSVENFKKGIGLMEERFGEAAATHTVYIRLLGNVSNSYKKSKKYHKAAKWHEKAKKARRSVRK